MSQLDQRKPLSEFDHFFQEGLFDVFKKKEKPPIPQPQTLRDIADVFKAKGYPTEGIEQLAAAYEDPEFVKGAEKTGHHVFQYEPWNKYLEENYKDVPDAIDDLRSLYIFPEKSLVSFINEEMSIRDIDKSTFDPSNHNEYDEQARVVCLAAATEQSDDTGIGYSLATGKIYHAYCWSDEDSDFLAEFSDFVKAVKAFAKSDAANDQSDNSYKEHHVNSIENTTDQIYTESRKGFSRAALSTRRAINRQFYRPLYMILLSEEDVIAKMIRKSTKSDWSHCALSLDVGMNHIYSFNIAHSKNSAYKLKALGGFSRESLFDPGCAGLRTRIYAVYVPESAFLRVQSQIGKWCENPKDTKYDYLAILKRIFVDDIKRGKSNDKKVCSSFVNDIMALAGRSVSKKVLPSPQDMDDMAKVTPSECYMVYDGAVRDYEPEKILKKLEGFTDSEISKPWVEYAIVQEQTAYGWNAYDQGTYPVEMPDNPTIDQKLILEIVHHNIDSLIDITEVFIVPYCKKHGLEKKATETALKLMSNGETDIDDWMNDLDHPSLGWGWVYPAVRGTVDSDTSATVVIDSTCEYMVSSSNNNVDRPSGYVQFVIKFNLAPDGRLTAEMISPEKSASVNCGKYNLEEIRGYLTEKEDNTNFEKLLKKRIRDMIPTEIVNFISNLAKEQQRTRKTTTCYKFKENVFPRVKSEYVDINEIWFVGDVIGFAASEIISDINYHKKEKLDASKIDEYVHNIKSIILATVGSMGDVYLSYKIQNGNIVVTWNGQHIANSWQEFLNMIEPKPDDRAETESTKVKKPKFSRFVQEEDQLSDEITVGDLSLDDLDDDNSETDQSDEASTEDSEDSDNSESPDDVPEYLKGRLSDDDLKAIESSETEDMDPNSVKLGTFGSDNSPEQNEYDPKDVDTLMKLMASEADAMAEYLDAAKETNTDVLRRLYADIGNEERFHMEQLLYAKCQLTGEKYEPKDPEVKSEYEELLAMGMDEETAMQTAVDRLHIRGSIETDVQDAAEIAGNISDDIATLEQAFAFFNAELARMESADSPEEANKAYATFVECCYINEAVHLKNSDDRGINITRNPVRLLLDALAFIMKQLIKLVRKIKEFASMVRNRKNDVRDFIKRYGWERIFDPGIKMYFDPTTNNGTIQVPQVLYQWAALAIETIELAAKNVGLANAVPPAYHEFCAKYRAASLSPSGDLSRAIGILNQVHLTPTKVLIPREKDEQEMFVSYLLGYQDMKAPNGQSRNIVNEYQNAVETWEKINKIAENVLNFMYEHENDANFTKFRNPSAYNKSVEAFQTIGKTFSSFSTAITADINTIIKLNKTVYDEMKRMDDEFIQQNRQNNPGT